MCKPAFSRFFTRLLTRVRRFVFVSSSAAFELPFSELIRFLALRRSYSKCRSKGSLHHFHLHKLNRRPLVVREGTTDALVLQDVIWRSPYLPPRPIPASSVIFDIGANIGCCSAHLACIYPNARIVAVEMERSNARIARMNTSSFGDRVSVVEAAVWPRDGVVFASGNNEDAYQARQHLSMSERGFSVAAISMTSLMSSLDVQSIDYLKMDVEGAEELLFSNNPTPWLERTRSLKVEIHNVLAFDLIFDCLLSHGFHTIKDPLHWSCIAAWRNS